MCRKVVPGHDTVQEYQTAIMLHTFSPFHCNSCNSVSLDVYVYQLIQLFISLRSTKIYLKFTLKCSYMFRSVTIIRELLLGSS